MILFNTPVTSQTTLLPISYRALGSNPGSFYHNKPVYVATCLYGQPQVLTLK
jgi:hypothetical protein